MKNSNDIIGNRTRDLLACSAVPQPTAPPAACPLLLIVLGKIIVWANVGCFSKGFGFGGAFFTVGHRHMRSAALCLVSADGSVMQTNFDWVSIEFCVIWAGMQCPTGCVIYRGATHFLWRQRSAFLTSKKEGWNKEWRQRKERLNNKWNNKENIKCSEYKKRGRKSKYKKENVW